MKWDEWRSSYQSPLPVMWVKRLFKRSWLGIDLHKMMCADKKNCFHTHPYYAVRIILYGGYVEQLDNGRLKPWLPGMFGIVKPSTSRRVEYLFKSASYSLWIRFRKCAEVELRGEGWKS